MQAKRLLTVAAIFAAALFILDAPAANADDYRSLTSGSWANYQSWQIWDTGTEPPAWRNARSGEVPGADDFATIDHHIDVDTTNEYADHITVGTSGQLDIEAGCTLTVDGSDNSTSTVNGTINLEYSSPNYGTLAFTDTNQALTQTAGAHKIVGANHTCLITISDGETLTSQITIEGCLTIDESSGSATFTNGSGGLVHANDDSGCTLEIATNSLGVSAGNWQVSTHSGNFLKLNHGSSAGTHSGNFTVSDGTLDIDANVTTTGNLSFTGDTIEVASGVTFQAS